MEPEKNIPENYQHIMPYLVIPNADKFIAFMKTVFGATEQYKAMRDENTIMHAELSIKGSTIMFAGCTDTFTQQNAGMFIYVDNCDETYHKALDNGAESIIPPANQSYGRSAGVKDPFGNTWWVTNVL
ncbi:VOC family protein [Mucilaginibacter ginsenosidivorax]|uniref:VOC family protein n=1 Tax=Mucilaginibacter ginsenosidivorax TaxID=862126 RepID=A0A5B8W2R6_9SPHI|nr:VOC family protein [Mucilaginibacter ginsenosidivorax]QEC77232.1 VOC family protein [Mucilaginibacter ginsenosidivorax]